MSSVHAASTESHRVLPGSLVITCPEFQHLDVEKLEVTQSEGATGSNTFCPTARSSGHAGIGLQPIQ